MSANEVKSAMQFRDRVYLVVAGIPVGKVMSYGDIAICCGQPRAARIVGQLAHFGPAELPWHRVVNRFGGLASGYYSGRVGQMKMLEKEGLNIDNNFVVMEFEEHRWYPSA